MDVHAWASFTIANDDLAHFNLYCVQTRPAIRQQWRRLRIGCSLLMAAALVLGFQLILDVGWLVALAVGVGFGLVCWLGFPWIQRRLITSELKRLSNETGLGVTGQVRLWLDDGGIHEEVGGTRTSTAWSGIAGVEEDDRYGYIFQGPYSAFMLPKHGDHDAEEFLAAVRARVGAAS